MNPHLHRALVLMQQSRYELAEKELRLALAEEPESPQAHAFLALCLNEREEFAEATDEAQRGIRAAPDWPTAHSILAQVFVSRRRFDEAEMCAQEALRLDPEDPHFHELLARIYMLKRDWARALESAERGLALDAEHVECGNLRAMALTKLGRTQEAARTVEAALAREPENALSHANLGWNYLHQANPKKALEHFREALRIEPTNEWARQGMVEALKARNLIYGLMLRYFLWMARLSGRMQWVIVLGLYFGYRALQNLAAQNPAWGPWIQPLLIGYIIFAVMTWVSSPLFNLLLRLNRYGRYALSRDQRLGSTVFGIMLIPALASLAFWAATGSGLGMLASVYFGLLLLPVTAIFRCSPGWPRWTMVFLTLVVAALMPAGFVIWMLGNKELGENMMLSFGWATLLSSFAANFLMMATVRR
jgi:tetratricopeptide (TPR) repeat protein